MKFGRAASVVPAMHRLFDQLAAIAPATYPVVLRGEYGSGRATLAEAMHEVSRPGTPCIVVDLAAIPTSLVESALFGYVKGSFTGQVTIRRGPFEEAESGTVILRELGALHAELQPKLLRVVRERKFKRIGENVMRPFNGRIIATTSRDLDTLCDLGWLRADLREEIARVEIAVPPLRERLADLEMLLADRRPTAEQLARISRLAWRGNFARWNAFVAERDLERAITELELLEAIEDAPDDDGPRLVYADALASRGDVRGEWIPLQVRQAQAPDDRKVRAAEKKLRETHYKTFANPVLDIGTTPVSTASVLFERGFVDGLVVDGESLRNFDAILAAAPLITRVITSGQLDSCVWTAPSLRVLRSLEVTSRVDALVLETVARCPYLTGLRSLTLTGEPVPANPTAELSQVDCVTLSTSPQLAGVTRLALRGYAIPPVNLATLFGDRAAWTLRELDLEELSPLQARELVGAPKASALTSLRVSRLDDESREILQALTATTIYVDNQVHR